MGRVLWLAVVLLLAGLPAGTQAAAKLTAYTPHCPITINDNVDFLRPTSGVIAGSGSIEDPYVIAGWDIDLSGPVPTAPSAANILCLLPPHDPYEAVSLRGTTAYVVIRDCHLHDSAKVGEMERVGIGLIDAQHVTIQDVTMDNLIEGIDARSAPGLHASNITVHGPGVIPSTTHPGAFVGTKGIMTEASDGVTLSDVQVDNMLAGVELWGGSHIILRNLILRDNNSTGITLVADPDQGWKPVDDVFIRNASVTGSRWGLESSFQGTTRVVVQASYFGQGEIGLDPGGTVGMVIEDSAFVNNTRAGIEGSSTQGLIVQDSRFSDNGLWGLRLGQSGGAVVQRNGFVLNGKPDRVGVDGTVEFYDTHGVRFLRNQVTDNAAAGLELGYDSNATVVENNTIARNGIGYRVGGGRGFGINVLSPDNVIRYNHVNGNGGSGIEMWDVHGNRITGNDLSGNGGPDVAWERPTQDANQVGPNDGVPDFSRTTTPKRADALPTLVAFSVLLGLALRRR